MNAPSYPDAMTPRATDAQAQSGLWARLTRRLTRAEYALGVIVALAFLLLFRSTDSAARWIYPAAIVSGWSIWLLAVAPKSPQRSDAINPKPLPAPGRCRWCGLHPRAMLCGGRSDGGSCEVADASPAVGSGHTAPSE